MNEQVNDKDANDLIRGAYYAENGIGTEIDLKKAAIYYKKAADLGDAYAQYKLGDFYANGNGIPKNSQMAKRYYTLSSCQGHDLATEALKEFLQKTRILDIDDFTLYNLGHNYEYGEGDATKNISVAIKYYQWAADLGNERAQLKLGSLYANGEGVPQDCKMAARYYRQATDQENDLAADALQELLKNNPRLEYYGKNTNIFFKFTKKASSQQPNSHLVSNMPAKLTA